MNILWIILYLAIFQYYNIIISSDGAKILGVFPNPGYSQYILGEKLMSTLAERGHEITMISAYLPRIPIRNYRTISTDGILLLYKDENLFLQETNNMYSNIMSIYELGYRISEFTLKNDKIQKFLYNSNETFDLVIVEQFFSEALFGFARHFKAPLILFSSIGSSDWNNHLMGNPILPSIMPLSHSSYTNQMGFFQRLNNFIGTVYHTIYRYFIYYPLHDKLIQQYFPKTTTTINFYDTIYNASLMLLNSHYTTTENSPLVRGMVEIGGFHLEPIEELPKHLEDFLNSADNGVILVSMGTNLKSADLSELKIQQMLNVFSKIKMKIVWKFERNLTSLPDNVYVSKWLPQKDILAHRNLRIFITHSGLLSTTEAIYHGIPMISIPIFGDQKMNSARVVRNRIAIKINFNDLDETTLYNAIKEINTNESYRKKSKFMSNLLKDQIVKPLDLAIFTVEQILKYDGCLFMKSATFHLHWTQLYLIDIFIFIIVVPFLSIYFNVIFIKRKRSHIKRTYKKKKDF